MSNARPTSGLVVTVVVALAIALAGCASGSDQSRPSGTPKSTPAVAEVVEKAFDGPAYAYYEKYNGYLVGDYPEKLVPLYECDLVAKATVTWDCTADATVQKATLSSGRGLRYHVEYVTSASAADVAAYYTGLMGANVTSKYSPDALGRQLTGTIGDYDVGLAVGKPEGDQSMVKMQVFSARDDISAFDLYLAELPAGIIPDRLVGPKGVDFPLTHCKYTVASPDGGQLQIWEWAWLPTESSAEWRAGTAEAENYFRQRFTGNQLTENSTGLRWGDGQYSGAYEFGSRMATIMSAAEAP